MESFKTITKTILISPKDLNSDILSTIKEKIKEKNNICDEDGVITSIGEIKKMTNSISRNGKYVYFTIDFDVNIVKPFKTAQISFYPSLIIAKGIFGKLYGCINFFIPFEGELKSWTFENNIFKKGKKIISKETEIKAIINEIMFDTNKFNCICSLV
jgi:hypothetical protein